MALGRDLHHSNMHILSLLNGVHSVLEIVFVRLNLQTLFIKVLTAQKS